MNRPGGTCTVNDTDRPEPLRRTPGPDKLNVLLPAPEPDAVSVVATGQLRLNDAEAERATVLGAGRTVDRDDDTGPGVGAGCCTGDWLERAGGVQAGELLGRGDGRAVLRWATVTRWVTRTVCLGVGELTAALLLSLAERLAATGGCGVAACWPAGL